MLKQFKNSNKKEYVFTIILIIAFVISLIPIIYLAKYDFATGDDLGYGTLTHNAWLSSHSLGELMKAVWNTIIRYYVSWQGTWFTVALMSLQPEVFNKDAYWITPIIMLLITIIATTALVRTLAEKYVGMSKWAWLSVDVLILMATIQYFPSTASSIFWFNGCVHYIIPFGLAVIAVCSMLKFRIDRRKIYVIWAAVAMTLLGGSSYLMPIFVIVVLLYLLLYDLISKDKKPIWEMLLPFGLECIGLAVSFASPGNWTRGGEDFDFTLLKMLGTIAMSFVQAAKDILNYAKQYPFVYVCLIFIGLISFYAFSKEETKFSFRLPGLFIAAMFCLFASVYAPAIFADVEVSGGVPNTEFQVFVLTAASSIVYFSGWLGKKCILKNQGILKDKGILKNKSIIILYGAVIIGCMLWLYAGKETVKESTAYESYIYYASGQADDYMAQMNYNRAILLDENIDNCLLCPINDDQGPLMHMPVVDDIENFTNRVNMEFYGKESVLVDKSLNISGKN